MNSVQFQPITPLWDVFPPDAATPARNDDQSGAFASIFQSAIDTVRETDAAKTEAQYLLATGQLDNPAELTLAASKAQLSLDLLIQLRNKALDAYSELIRINL